MASCASRRPGIGGQAYDMRRARIAANIAKLPELLKSKVVVLSHTREVQMAKEGDEVIKEFVRRVNALLDRLQKTAGEVA
jgi:hypothetical protein